MKKLKQAKGITLVALVINIIILLILAGISILALTNQGLFKQAQNAKNLTEEKTAEENEILTSYLEQMNAIIGGQVTESIPDGAAVTPINDITIWLKTGGISKQYSYTTVEQVIADSTCTKSLMKNENAMKYLARSTEFANAICASETTMTYLGQSEYVDDTVLNSDIWCQTIKASQYWTLVYASNTVTIYGAASETITIEGYYGSFTTGTDGSCSHVVPLGEITLTGSVSQQSFTRMVTSDTTEVYVMPEGALYWYGNECTGVTDGFGVGNFINPPSCESIAKESDHLYFYTNGGSVYPWGKKGYATNKKIHFNSSTKLNIEIQSTVGRESVINVGLSPNLSDGGNCDCVLDSQKSYFQINTNGVKNVVTYSPELDGDYYFYALVAQGSSYGTCYGRIYKIWLE